MSKKVTLCITTYNRREQLESCLDSFIKTNMYPWEDLELIIVDNGSDEPSAVQFIENLEVKNFYSFKKIINEKNDYPFCLRRAKNQARAAAQGDYFIDCPDDHIFVVKSDWIRSSIEFIEKEKEKVSCVCHYAYPLYRFSKPANKVVESKLDNMFFLTPLKGYADYHVMKREAYEDIGEYDETLAFTPNSEDNYMDRAKEKGYKRSLLRIPVSIIIDKNTGWRGKYAKLLKPILPSTDIPETIGFRDRPLCNEELILIAKNLGCLEERFLPPGIE